MNKIKSLLSRIPIPAVLFAIIAFVSGSVYIMNIGPFSGPDLHHAHYKAALAFATGQSFVESDQLNYGRVQYISGSEKYFESGESCVKGQLVAATITNPLLSDDAGDCVRDHDMHLSSDEVTVPAVLQYPFLSYMPQAIGIGVGILTDMEPIDAQTLARYMNLLVYITVVVASIIMIPRGKWFVALLAVLPTSLFLASSLSADSLNIAWNILFVSYILRLYAKDKPLRLGQKVIISVLGLGLFMLKVAYVPILLLILALKPSVIRTRDKWLLFLTTALVGTIIYTVWSSNWSSLSSLVDTSTQLSAIFNNLHLAVASILLNIFYLPNILFGQHTMYVVLTLIILAMLIGHIVSSKPEKPKGITDATRLYKMQILGAIAAIGSLFLTYAALLLTWTDLSQYGWLNIQGFQGRYVVPLLPLLLTVYYLPRRIESSSRRRGGSDVRA